MSESTGTATYTIPEDGDLGKPRVEGMNHSFDLRVWQLWLVSTAFHLICMLSEASSSCLDDFEPMNICVYCCSSFFLGNHRIWLLSALIPTDLSLSPWQHWIPSLFNFPALVQRGRDMVIIEDNSLLVETLFYGCKWSNRLNCLNHASNIRVHIYNPRWY